LRRTLRSRALDFWARDSVASFTIALQGFGCHRQYRSTAFSNRLIGRCRIGLRRVQYNGVCGHHRLGEGGCCHHVCAPSYFGPGSDLKLTPIQFCSQCSQSCAMCDSHLTRLLSVLFPLFPVFLVVEIDGIEFCIHRDRQSDTGTLGPHRID
jgi:hypothetical protein